MKKPTLYILIVVLLLVAMAAFARTMASTADVRSFYNTMEKMPTDKLLAKGKELSDANKPDSAIVCYTIVTKREKKSMQGDELKPYLSAWGWIMVYLLRNIL